MSLPTANNLAALRRRLAALEAVPSLARLRGALHEVAARAESDMAAASGFTLALAASAGPGNGGRL